MMVPSLPEDLLEEILCRVPTTSLKRLRSTCKRWNRLFNDVRFSRNHLEKSPKNQFLVLMSRADKVFKFSSISINLHGNPSLEVKGNEPSLIDPCSGRQVRVFEVFHCDGLLLCKIVQSHTRIVVWNPCTGQTRWIQPRSSSKLDNTYVFGSYQDGKRGSSGYKILSYKRYYSGDKLEFAISEINSTSSWRNLDIIQDFKLKHEHSMVSLKGKTYWFASDVKEEKATDVFLISFDYTKERFRRLPLPVQPDYYCNMNLSVVGEEKLSVLLRNKVTRMQEMWVTNKVDETKAVSWSKILEVDLGLEKLITKVGYAYSISSLLVNEEKNEVVLFSSGINTNRRLRIVYDHVYIVGEDKNVKKVDIEAAMSRMLWPDIPHYVPSFIQIPRGGKKRKFKSRLVKATK